MDNNKTKKKITVQPGCISCGCCKYVAPEVFELEVFARVKVGADIENNWDKIKKAAQQCPVGAIVIEE